MRAIWDRLLGCFGDALLRKFGAEPPQEWIGAIGQLGLGQLERGMRRLVFGWKGGPPTLPDFMRLCRSVGTDDFDEGNNTQPRLSTADNFGGDAWAMVANRYLLGHIHKRMSGDPRFYGRGASYAMLTAGTDKVPPGTDQEFVRNMHALVAAKNAWADDMRDIAQDGEVDPEMQKAIWRDWIQRAESQMVQDTQGVAA